MFWTQFRRSQIHLAHEQDDFALLSVRMASWNQILDPWVYILLRRVVFYKVFSSFNTQTRNDIQLLLCRCIKEAS